MYDFHVHSNFSCDSSSTMISMAESGKSSELEGICFTDHIDLDCGDSHIDYKFSYNDYIKELDKARASVYGNFEIFTGIEIGMQPHISAENNALLEGGSFDFVIGSIHTVNKKDMYDGSYLEGLTHNEGIMSYFRDLLQCLDNFNGFDVLGHLDGVRRYLGGKEESFSYDIYEEQIHNVLSKLIASGKGIEVNTSGLRYGLSSFHPLPDILRLYKSLGGEIVTLGSDSHKPGTLGFEFKNVLPMLSKYGFKYYSIFKERKPVFIKI